MNFVDGNWFQSTLRGKDVAKTLIENDEVLLAGFGRKGKAKGDIVSTGLLLLLHV